MKQKCQTEYLQLVVDIKRLEGVQGGRRRPQAARPARLPPLKQP
jgi:hypothetical protein